MASIKEVADMAGVSVSTVSLVLNGKGHIRPETRQRVMDVVSTLGYRRSINGRNLRDQQSRVVGYGWFGKRSEFNPVLDTFLFEMARLTEANGRHIMLFSVDSSGSIDAYRELIGSRRIDGFILSHTNQDDPRFELLYEANFPFVAFGRSASPLDDLTHWVDIDGAAGVYDAMCHLIQQGHQQIAFIGWPVGSASGDSRFQGYVDALRDHGMAYDPALVLRTENEVSGGYSTAHRLLDSAQELSALVAVSDLIAIGAMRCFAEAGRRIAVTGFDNSPISEFTYPPLTSIRQPVETVASILVDMLLKQLDGVEVIKKQHLLKPELIIRPSSTLAYPSI